ncbi:response regulator [Breoghania sp. L-A4]|uniref:response regulator n=1 Tax=Breoghania sp. L-A4 TaxID=2304600 RepID=UPI000E35DCBB|nr:response regulator [Breoghania sp. L-A4]AXS38749.1 response regulator [Breoghania sp. L-A4]
MARILVTEDDEAVRTFVKRALELDGHDVDVAEDGAEALETLKRNTDSYDLLLSDIKMPVMDGIALALVVARDWPQVPILLMTGYADQRERAHGLDALVHDVVTKPFSLADIRRIVGKALIGEVDNERRAFA